MLINTRLRLQHRQQPGVYQVRKNADGSPMGGCAFAETLPISRGTLCGVETAGLLTYPGLCRAFPIYISGKLRLALSVPASVSGARRELQQRVLSRTFTLFPFMTDARCGGSVNYFAAKLIITFDAQKLYHKKFFTNFTLQTSKTADFSMIIGYDGKRAMQNMTGLGNYSRLVVGSMSAMYPSNSYILMCPRRRDNDRLAPIIGRDNVSVVTPSSAIMRRVPAWWRSVEMVHDWPRLGLDIYHGLSNEIPLTASLAPVPTVVTIHDLIWRRIPGDYAAVDRRLYDFKYCRSARIATRIIAISERTKADIVADWNISPDKIDVVYQGCDPIFSCPVTYDDRTRVRNLYHLPDRYILSVGTLQGRKNQLLAVRALPSLPADVSLVLVGGGDASYIARIDAEARSLGVDSRVVRLTDIPFDHLPALYACAVFSSYTSRYEGFGIPVIESLSVGTPVVACTGSCLEEAGGGGAIYVNPDDTRAYAEAARGLLDKAYLRDRLAEQGRRHIRRFSPSAFTSGILTTYNKAILDFSLQ